MNRYKLSYKTAGLIVLASTLLFTTGARAVPTLQVDILGGYYDELTETVYSRGPTFSLLAYGTPGSETEASILGQTFYLSAALVPKITKDPSFDAGSFTIDDTTVYATDGSLSYGLPPSGDDNLGSHGIYETYYHEVEFSFDANDTTTVYNTQPDAGGDLFDESGSGMFFKRWDFNVAGLGSYQLHFDFYNADRSLFAPFSHDAQSAGFTFVSFKVPEPSNLAVLGLGFVVLGFARRKRKA